MTKKQKKVEKKLLAAIDTNESAEDVNFAVRSYFNFVLACGNMDQIKRLNER